MDHEMHEDGAARQLDAIHAGGNHLIVVVRQRVGQVLDALDEGDFSQALEKLEEASARVTPLARAQQFIAIADGSRLMLAAEVEVGMTLTAVGEVAHVEVNDCPSALCRRHISLKVGDHDLMFYGDQEVYVNADGE